METKQDTVTKKELSAEELKKENEDSIFFIGEKIVSCQNKINELRETGMKINNSIQFLQKEIDDYQRTLEALKRKR